MSTASSPSVTEDTSSTSQETCQWLSTEGFFWNAALNSKDSSDIQQRQTLIPSDLNFIRAPLPDELEHHFVVSESEAYVKCLNCDRMTSFDGQEEPLRQHLQAHKNNRNLVPDTYQAVGDFQNLLVSGLSSVAALPYDVYHYGTMSEILQAANSGSIDSIEAERIAAREYNQCTIQLSYDFSELRAIGSIFTCAVGHWTWNYKSYVSITIRTSIRIPCVDDHCLELLVRDSAPKKDAEDLFQAVSEQLGQVGLSLMDMCGLTTDNTHLMREFANLVQDVVGTHRFNHHTCMARALRLAVLTTLKGKLIPSELKRQALYYSIPLKPNTYSEEFSEPKGDGADSTSPLEYDETEEILDTVPFWTMKAKPLMSGGEWDLIQKVRAYLDYTVKKCGSKFLKLAESLPERERKIILDDTINWRSSLRMLKRYFKLKSVLDKLYEVEKEPFPITEGNINSLRSLVDALEVVDQAIVTLSRGNLKLQECKNFNKNIFKRLSALGSPFSRQLKLNLHNELKRVHTWPMGYVEFDAPESNDDENTETTNENENQDTSGLEAYNESSNHESITNWKEAILATVAPTIISAEETFTKARHLDFFRRKSLTDVEFSRDMFLRDFYKRSGLHEKFLKKFNPDKKLRR